MPLARAPASLACYLIAVMSKTKQIPLRLEPRDHTRIRMAAAASGKSMNAWCTSFLTLAARYTLKRRLLTSSYGGEEVREALERESEEIAEELLGRLGGAPGEGISLSADRNGLA